MSELYLDTTEYEKLVGYIEKSVVQVKEVTDKPDPGTTVLCDIIDLNAKIAKLTKDLSEHITLDLVPSLNKTEAELKKVDTTAKQTLNSSSGAKGDG